MIDRNTINLTEEPLRAKHNISNKRNRQYKTKSEIMWFL